MPNAMGKQNARLIIRILLVMLMRVALGAILGYYLGAIIGYYIWSPINILRPFLGLGFLVSSQELNNDANAGAIAGLIIGVLIGVLTKPINKSVYDTCVVIFYSAIANFLIFFVIGVFIGDALNGKIEEGHYYLSNHGNLLEVNYVVFMYSKLHALSMLVTHPLGMIAAGLSWITR